MITQKLGDLVHKFLHESKDDVLKKEVLNLWQYVTVEYPFDLIIAKRNYELGFAETNDEWSVHVKCYQIENRLRVILGVPELPKIVNSII